MSTPRVLVGSYRGLPASVIIDPAFPTSLLGEGFASTYNLPRTFSPPSSWLAHGPVYIPSTRGYYVSSFRLVVGSVTGYDIVLGRDWLSFTGAVLSDSGVDDPVHPPPGLGHSWLSNHYVNINTYASLSTSAVVTPSSVNSSSSSAITACSSCLSLRTLGLLEACSSCSFARMDRPMPPALSPAVATAEDVVRAARVSVFAVSRQPPVVPSSTPLAAHASRGSQYVTFSAATQSRDGSLAVLSQFSGMTSAQLACLMVAHGLLPEESEDDDDRRERLLCHIADALCTTSSEHPACRLVQGDLFSETDVERRTSIWIALVDSVRQSVSKKTARALLSRLRIAFLPSESLRQLRSRLRQYVRYAKKGKELRQRPPAPPPSTSPHPSGPSGPEPATGPWPQVLSDAFKKHLVDMFNDETSSKSLATVTCAACAESILVCDARSVAFSDVRREVFEIPEGHLPPGMPLPVLPPVFDGCLLEPLGLDAVKEQCILCAACHDGMLSGHASALALVNHTYLGEVPPELRDLTAVEESVIARCRAKAMIVHLRQDGQSANSSVTLPNMQRGLRGHIIIHPQHPEGLIDVLPSSVEEIMKPIAVLFVGSTPPDREWLLNKAKPLAVNRGRILAALTWLKTHNPAYADITIDYHAIEALPENGPLPFEIETLAPSDAQDAAVSRYDPPTSVHVSAVSEGGDADNPTFPSVVIADVEGSAPANELRAAALRHVKEKGGGFVAIPHDPKPVKEWCNPTLFPTMYPSLFPYGEGGFEDSRRKPSVGVKRHVKHLLNLTDRRFQLHSSFMFIVFNILQRREVLLRSSLKVKRSSFDYVAQKFASLRPEAVARVCERMASNDFSGPDDEDERQVADLLKHVNLVSRGVPGSSSAKLNMRNQVRAMMAEHGLPSFYLTINPADVYHPLVRFLAGEEIDIDALPLDQPHPYWQQSVTVAKNPTATARFFNIYMKAIIKCLLGFDPVSKTSTRDGGILGRGQAYFGCVEAQGRGTLHCHMVVWLKDAMNPNEIRERVLAGDDDFAQRLIAFLEDTIATSSPVNPEPASNAKKHRNPCSHRGIPADTPADVREVAAARDLHELVEACQRHKHNATCYKYWRPGERKACRFDLDPKNVTPTSSFNDDGEFCLRCLDGLVNNFNETMLRAIRCNMDIKFIGSGEAAKAILYYITDYITKSPLKAHVAYAALELAVRRLGEYDPSETPCNVRAKQLLQKSAMAMLTFQELSAPQVVSYLMDFEDCFSSHSFNNLYWPSMERLLNEQSPSPECYSRVPLASLGEEDDDGDDAGVEADDHADGSGDASLGNDGPNEEQNLLAELFDEVRVSSTAAGTLREQADQVADYVLRGAALGNVNVWDFVSQFSKVSGGVADVEETYSTRALLHHMSLDRPQFAFDSAHPEATGKCVELAPYAERKVPVLIGSAVPRRDRRDRYPKYCRLMLLLFKPWRGVADLRSVGQSWEDAFAAFCETADEYVLSIMDNMQLIHECKEARNDNFRSRAHHLARSVRVSAELRANAGPSWSDLAVEADEDDILEHLESIQAATSDKQTRMAVNTLQCLDTADKYGLYPQSPTVVLSGSGIQDADSLRPELVTEHDNYLEEVWQSTYADRRRLWKETLTKEELARPTQDPISDAVPTVMRLDDLRTATGPYIDSCISSESPGSDGRLDIEQFVKKWTLNVEQARAFRVVAEHASAPTRQPQLRMLLSGAGGTGKSRVIHALQDFFVARQEARRFRLSSFTGVAARNISGMTLHSALSLDQWRTSCKPGSQANIDLVSMWRGVDYLFVDEVSMVGCQLLAKISRALMMAKENESDFGNINIIFAGDFAQLPPVRETRLYAKLAHDKPGADVVLGKLLWLTVDTVVRLTESNRQAGTSNIPFVQLLGRLREGRCTAADVKLLNTRLLSRNTADVRTEAWEDVPTIVYDNASKDALNVRAVKSFAARTGKELQWYYSFDTHHGQPLANPDLREWLWSRSSGDTQQRLGRIPLVLGMKIMVSHNFDVAGGIVNGSIGILKRIRYVTRDDGKRYLRSCIVEIPKSEFDSLEQLQPHEAAILCDTLSISIQHPFSKRTCVIRRTQVPVQPGYAFTAHRAQGQTYDHIVVDLAGCRNIEAAYVMLSRVTKLSGLLILRPFTLDQLTCKPDPAKQAEDHRLLVLELQTRLRHSGERLEQLELRRQLDDLQEAYIAAKVDIPEDEDERQELVGRLSKRRHVQKKRASPQTIPERPSKRRKVSSLSTTT